MPQSSTPALDAWQDLRAAPGTAGATQRERVCALQSGQSLQCDQGNHTTSRIEIQLAIRVVSNQVRILRVRR